MPQLIPFPDAPPLDRSWPDPPQELLESPAFEAVWQAIKTWDIAVPGAYHGYCGATGNHVRAILDAMEAAGAEPGLLPASSGRKIAPHSHGRYGALEVLGLIAKASIARHNLSAPP